VCARATTVPCSRDEGTCYLTAQMQNDTRFRLLSLDDFTVGALQMRLQNDPKLVEEAFNLMDLGTLTNVKSCKSP
jgi:hypothetical protein